MKINNYSTSIETKSELVRRFKAYRISLNLTQLDVANKSGISLGAVKSFERTGIISLDSLIKLLKALCLLENIDALIPDLGVNVVELHDLGHQRQRVRKKRGTNRVKWGDEQ